MPTVKEVRAILEPFSDAEMTEADCVRGRVHVHGFVTTSELKPLV